MKISKITVVSNKLLETKYKTYVRDSYNVDATEIIMFHITSKDNAVNILENGFDTNLAKMGAFGKGINLTTDVYHLRNYYNAKNPDDNYIVVCNVKFYKKMLNTSGPEKLNDGYTTKPRFETPPPGYDALYAEGPKIYVIPNSEQVNPLYIAKISIS